MDEIKAKADDAFRNKNYDEAIELYSAAIELAPDMPTLYNNRSAAFHNANVAWKALEDAEKSLSFEETQRGYQRKANALRKLGRFDEAVVAYKKAIQLAEGGDPAIQEVIKEIEGFGYARSQMTKPMMQAIAKCTDVKKNDSDPFGSGDQSEIGGRPQSEMPGGKAQKLREVWAGGGDFNPDEINFPHTDFLRAVYRGDVKAVKRSLTFCGDDEQKKFELVNRRESILRLSPLIACVASTRKVRGPAAVSGVLASEIAKLLIEAGADVHAKDIAGYSVIHHASTATAGPGTLRLIPLLVERGADPNNENRFGDPPIMEPVMSNNPETVKALIQFGADVHKKSSSGVLAMNLCRFNPTMTQVIASGSSYAGIKVGDKVQIKGTGKDTLDGQYGTVLQRAVGSYELELLSDESADAKPKKITASIEQVVRLDSSCAKCGGIKNLMQCGRCKKVKYCSPDCQKAHWKEHKAACQERPDWVLSRPKGGLNKQFTADLGSLGEIKAPKDRKGAKQTDDIIVKVQIPMDISAMMPNLARSGGAGKNDSICIYNESKSLEWYITPSDSDDYDAITASVKKSGVSGLKAYYGAKVVDGKLHICQEVLPPQPW